MLNNLEQLGGGRGTFVIWPGPFSPFTRPPCPSHLFLSLLLLFSFPLTRSPENPQPATTAVRLAGKPGRDHSGPCAPPTPPPTPPLSFPSELHRHLHFLLTSHAAITTESSPNPPSLPPTTTLQGDWVKIGGGRTDSGAKTGRTLDQIHTCMVRF